MILSLVFFASCSKVKQGKKLHFIENLEKENIQRINIINQEDIVYTLDDEKIPYEISIYEFGGIKKFQELVEGKDRSGITWSSTLRRSDFYALLLTFVSIVAYLLFLSIAIVKLLVRNFRWVDKLLWFVILLILPILGSVLFLVWGKNYAKVYDRIS